jgi:hypothetical protein
LFIGDLASSTWRRVPALDGRFTTAAVSPDGTRVIASRHSDFDVPGSPDDDTLFIIDVESLAVIDIVPQQTDHWPVELHWSADGQAVFVVMSHNRPSQWVELASKKRTQTDEPLAPLTEKTAYRWKTCKKDVVFPNWDDDVKVRTETGEIIIVVREEGRIRGYHDYVKDFGYPVLTPGCGYVVFHWRNEERQSEVWLADAAGSGQFGPLIAGNMLFFADPQLLLAVTGVH